MDLPSAPALRTVVERLARLRSRLGDELGERPLVLPTGEFFPDEFRADEPSVKRLVTRLKRHAGMSDIPTRTRVAGLDHDCGGGSCGASRGGHGGGCGDGCGGGGAGEEPIPRLVDTGETWRITVPAPELRHPVLLGANLARLLSFVFLAETLPEGEALEAPADVTADLTGVLLGFGVLLLQGSYIYQKSCGGPRIARATRLGPGELAVATALFAKLGGHAVRGARRALDATQAAAFAEAWAWVESNEALVEALRRDPARVARGGVELSETQPWLTRALGRKARPGSAPRNRGEPGLEDGPLAEIDDLLATLPEARRPRARPTTPEDEELKALVAEALDEATDEPLDEAARSSP
ncbi:MAG TPA: hypothetical protein PLU22_23780 [Polyangiaceae bacterium]|nr:hypothetical protein [Polyangiaceae bacterium]